ncbi:flagellar hook-length control protein FliK [Sulfurimonas paralvinellae]|nr:flagellar hook-length control protein FliK [Sulfurimonas paralvinellae]
MIQLNTSADKTLNIFLSNTNKALREVLKDIAPKEMQQLSQAKDLGSILESLLKNRPQDQLQNQTLLTLLKNNPTLKELGNVSTTLKELQQLLQKNETPMLNRLKIVVVKSLENITNIDENSLKNKIENSGLFLESKLKNASSKQEIQELLSNDTKAVVKKSLEELNTASLPNKDTVMKQLDKLSMQIDYYQLLSHLNDASALYLPYSFDALEEGNITIKNAKNKKFFCDIDLQLKEYGSLRLRLGLFEKNQLNINISCESPELKDLLHSNIKDLKKSLYDVGIIPTDIRFLDAADVQMPYGSGEEIELGFEVKA